MSAKKRASPGAEEEKNLFEVDISDETIEKLKGVSNDLARVELALDRAAQPKYRAAWEKRQEIIKSIPKFWPVALMNDMRFSMHVQYPDDRKALLYLEDVWVQRHEDEPRVMTISFTFAENPYFEDKVLVKEYKYTPPAASSDDKPDENGITRAMLNFDFEHDVEPQATKISWKEGQNLIEKHPRVGEGEDLEEEGSFFHYFEKAADIFELGQLLTNEIFPEAIDFFTGQAAQLDFDDSDEDEEDEEEDDEDEDEIDLEKPRPKKAKQA